MWRAIGRAAPADWLRDPLRLAIMAGHAAEDAADEERAALGRLADVLLATHAPQEAGRQLRRRIAALRGEPEEGVVPQDPVAVWVAEDQYWWRAEIEGQRADGDVRGASVPGD